MPFVKLAPQAELPGPGHAQEFSCNDKMICVANVNGTLSALDNVCLHHGGPLGQGYIEDGKVVCPWHGWQFDAETGQVGHHPDVRTKVYPVKIEGDDLLVEI